MMSSGCGVPPCSGGIGTRLRGVRALTGVTLTLAGSIALTLGRITLLLTLRGVA